MENQTRLNATPEIARHGKPAIAAHRRPESDCLECGEAFPRSRRERDFCGDSCRRAFNNRRMQRGAALYDLIMIVRFERKVATALKVWRAINRLAAVYRDDDHDHRDGRRSWRRIRDIKDSFVFLWHE